MHLCGRLSGAWAVRTNHPVHLQYLARSVGASEPVNGASRATRSRITQVPALWRKRTEHFTLRAPRSALACTTAGLQKTSIPPCRGRSTSHPPHHAACPTFRISGAACLAFLNHPVSQPGRQARSSRIHSEPGESNVASPSSITSLTDKLLRQFSTSLTVFTVPTLYDGNRTVGTPQSSQYHLVVSVIVAGERTTGIDFTVVGDLRRLLIAMRGRANLSFSLSNDPPAPPVGASETNKAWVVARGQRPRGGRGRWLRETSEAFY